MVGLIPSHFWGTQVEIQSKLFPDDNGNLQTIKNNYYI